MEMSCPYCRREHTTVVCPETLADVHAEEVRLLRKVNRLSDAIGWAEMWALNADFRASVGDGDFLKFAKELRERANW